jgi:IclR family transcriptional regulator, pca regulon regulatory protein
VPRIRPRAPAVGAEGGPAPSAPTLAEPRYSQSLERGLAILALFTPEHPALGIADIADGLGISRSTIYRYVVTLTGLGYLEQGTSRKYRLGLRVSDLGMSVMNSVGLREHAHEYLDRLRHDTTYTASLAVLDDTEIVYVDQVRSYRRAPNPIEMSIAVGVRLPVYCTSMGKLLIAHLPRSELRTVFARINLIKRGPCTITSKAALRKELTHIREDGFAVEDQELARDLHSIAVPVRDHTREVVGAISLSAHTSMASPTEMANALMPHLVSAADPISARLGYRRDGKAPARR